MDQKTQMEVQSETNKEKSKDNPQRRPRAAKPKQNVPQRAVLESENREITLIRKSVLNGQVITYDNSRVSFDLSELDEPSFQLVVRAFKIALNYANGIDITQKVMPKKGPEDEAPKEPKSVAQKFQHLIALVSELQKKGSNPPTDNEEPREPTSSSGFKP